MHPNPAFRRESEARAWETVRARGFGVLTAAGPDGLLAAHVPFVADPEAGRAEMHLVHSNPLARALRKGALDALLIVSGPDGYVSPDWYGEEDKVPTWNYVAVHLRGQLALISGDALRGHLDRLSAEFEARLAPKPPWTVDKLTPATLAGLMRQIVPAEITGLTVESTYKLNQNRTAPARAGAAEALAAGTTPGMETAMLAQLMHAVPED